MSDLRDEIVKRLYDAWTPMDGKKTIEERCNQLADALFPLVLEKLREARLDELQRMPHYFLCRGAVIPNVCDCYIGRRKTDLAIDRQLAASKEKV